MGREIVPKVEISGKNELRQERQVPKENKYLASKLLHRGHKFYKWKNGIVSECTDDDFYAQEIKLNEPMKVFIVPEGKHIGNYKKKKIKSKTPQLHTNVVRKLIIEEGVYYHGALNIENAVKYFKNIGLTVQLLQT